MRAEAEAVRADGAAIEADTRSKVAQSLRRKLDETAQLRAQVPARCLARLVGRVTIAGSIRFAVATTVARQRRTSHRRCDAMCVDAAGTDAQHSCEHARIARGAQFAPEFASQR